MKKTFAALAAASALALAACGGGNDDAATTDTAAAPAEDTASVMPTAQGMYTGTNADGQEWTANLRQDGTYEFTEGGEVTQIGTYDNNIRGTCLTEETGDTAAPGQEMCYNFGEVGPDGTVEVTGPDGVTFTMNKAS